MPDIEFDKRFIAAAAAGIAVVGIGIGGIVMSNKNSDPEPAQNAQEIVYDQSGIAADYMYGDYSADEGSTVLETEETDPQNLYSDEDLENGDFKSYTGYGISKDGIKIYEKPDDTSKELGTIEYGEAVKILSKTNKEGWCKVSTLSVELPDGVEAISKGYINVDDISETVPVHTIMYNNYAEDVVIHLQADEDSKKVGTITPGGTAKVWYEEDGWFRVTTDDCRMGYVKSEYMSDEEPAEVEENEPETMEDLLGSHKGPWGTASDFITPVTNSTKSDITGLEIDQSVYDQKTLAVIYPTKEDQPSYGIGNAEVLYEYKTGDTQSEFMGIIQDWQKLPVIGTQAEVKHYMIYNANEWDSLVIHNGSDKKAQPVFDEMKLMDLSQTQDKTYAGRQSAGSDFFYKSTTGKTVITADRIKQACASLSYPIRNQALQMYWHSNFATDGTETLDEYPTTWNATSVDLSLMFKDSHSAFKYNSKKGTYAKFINDGAQYDALTGDQLEFTNIIIQYCEYSTSDGILTTNTMETKESQGGYYITKGKCIPITWNKSNVAEPTKYFDEYGNEITLNTGKTYVGMVEVGTKINLN